MPETINTTFDPSTLPNWAKRYPEVIWLCKQDNAYRCSVYTTETEQMYRHLINMAMAARYVHDRND